MGLTLPVTESQTTQKMFSKNDLRILETFKTGGTRKRIVKVEVLDDKQQVHQKGVLKFMRAYQAGVKNQIAIPLSDRERELDQEVSTVQRLSDLIPNHVPKYLGRYPGLERGEVFEEVAGDLIADKTGKVIVRPTLEQINTFRTAITSLMEKRIFVHFDDLMDWNLLVGTTNSIKEPQIILAEATVDDYSQSNNTNQELLDQAKFRSQRGIDILFERYGKQQV